MGAARTAAAALLLMAWMPSTARAQASEPVVPPRAAAPSQLVQIEVLAFAFRTVAAPESTADAVTTSPPRPVVVSSDYAITSVPPPAPAVGAKLGTAWQRIHDDPNLVPLAHLRWRQGLHAREWVRLEGGDRFDGRLRLAPGVPHQLSLEATLPASDGRPVQQLRLTRAASFGEHVYFDHQAFGVIVRIDPVLAEPIPPR